LALTVLFLVLYLCLVQALSLAPVVAAWYDGLASVVTPDAVAYWQQRLQPFLAIQTVVEPGRDDATGWPPAYGFGLAVLAWSRALNAWGLLGRRKWTPSGEPVMQRDRPEDLEEKDRALAHAAPGPVRRVWANPILWREIATHAYGRRPLLVKAAYLVVFGLVCYYAIAGTQTREWAAA